MREVEFTIGKWNDDENYDMMLPLWRMALNFSEQYHEMSYIRFVQGAMRILIYEANLRGDNFLSVAALYGLLENTECTLEIIEENFGSWLAENAAILQRKFGESLKSYVERIYTDINNRWLLDVVMAFYLEELRLIKCPYDSWIEDIKYYNELDEAFTFIEPDGISAFLFEKLKEQIKENRKYSLNTNKTAEELSTGWDDQ